jgi:hypothetical protein
VLAASSESLSEVMREPYSALAERCRAARVG